jgi:hypothetical protein
MNKIRIYIKRFFITNKKILQIGQKHKVPTLFKMGTKEKDVFSKTDTSFVVRKNKHKIIFLLRHLLYHQAQYWDYNIDK